MRIGEKEGQGRGYGGKRNGEVKAGKKRGEQFGRMEVEGRQDKQGGYKESEQKLDASSRKWKGG